VTGYPEQLVPRDGTPIVLGGVDKVSDPKANQIDDTDSAEAFGWLILSVFQ